MRNKNPWWMWPLILAMLAGVILLSLGGLQVFFYFLEDVGKALRGG